MIRDYTLQLTNNPKATNVQRQMQLDVQPKVLTRMTFETGLTRLHLDRYNGSVLLEFPSLRRMGRGTSHRRSSSLSNGDGNYMRFLQSEGTIPLLTCCSRYVNCLAWLGHIKLKKKRFMDSDLNACALDNFKQLQVYQHFCRSPINISVKDGFAMSSQLQTN